MALNKYHWYISSKTCEKIGKIWRGTIIGSNILSKGDIVSEGSGEKGNLIRIQNRKGIALGRVGEIRKYI